MFKLQIGKHWQLKSLYLYPANDGMQFCRKIYFVNFDMIQARNRNTRYKDSRVEVFKI